ncbi:hypothetical protein [Micromonospora sp. NPDC005174]|uniref:hypothetical protein n=1 Tax=Micromonospora sp. NPDC005174 TaxID=3157018 RepID=UPI0033B63265
MTPAQDLKTKLRAHGYVVYDIGNEDHMEHEPPEDHTPYSETGYPGKATYGVGYAIDIMPPASGARSKVDGLPLPSLQQLGAQLLTDRNDGVAGIRWLKYMNWEPQRNNGGTCHQDSWKPTYARRSSTDRGHIHLSALTGFDSSTIGAGYDPVARIRGGIDMTPEEHKWLETVHKNLTVMDGRNPIGQVYTRITDGTDAVLGSKHAQTFPSLTALGKQLTAVQTLLTGLAGKDFTDEAAIVQGVLASLTPEKIAAAIPPAQVKAVADELAKRLQG